VKHFTKGLVEKSLKLIVEVCGTEIIESSIKDIFINATYLQDIKNIQMNIESFTNKLKSSSDSCPIGNDFYLLDKDKSPYVEDDF
jgi:hypothetical protein